MKHGFVVFALPRSRTAWTTKLLSEHGSNVIHDLAIGPNSAQALMKQFLQIDGCVETGSMLGWKLWRHAFPQVKFAVIRRPLGEVVDSLFKLGIRPDVDELVERAEILSAISSQPGTLTLTSRELGRASGSRALVEHCLGHDLDLGIWERLRNENIQINIPERIGELAFYAQEISSLKLDALGKLDELSRGFDPILASWIDEEPWIDVRDEIEPLARAHFNEVAGELEPKRQFGLDRGVMETLAKLGVLRVWVARVNGQVAGYCTWNISNDPESNGMLMADQGGWYVTPRYKQAGLGLGLLRAGLAGLKSAGVQNVLLHYRMAGRGDARLGHVFRRLGAVPHESRYSLWIGA